MQNPNKEPETSKQFENWQELKRALREGLAPAVSRYDSLAASTLILVETQRRSGDRLDARLSWFDGQMQSAAASAIWERQPDGTYDLVWDSFPSNIQPLALLIGDLSFVELSDWIRRPIETRPRTNQPPSWEDADSYSLSASSEEESAFSLSGSSAEPFERDVLIERLTAKDSWKIDYQLAGELTLSFFSCVELDRNLEAEVRFRWEDENDDDCSRSEAITLYPVVPSPESHRRCWQATIRFDQPKTANGRWIPTKIEACILQEEVKKLCASEFKHVDDRKQTCHAVQQFLASKEYESACFLWQSKEVRCKDVNRDALESTQGSPSTSVIIRGTVVEEADQEDEAPFDDDKFFPLWVLLDSMVEVIVRAAIGERWNRGGYSSEEAIAAVRFRLSQEVNRLRDLYKTQGLKALRDYSATLAYRELRTMSLTTQGITRRDLAAQRRVKQYEQYLRGELDLEAIPTALRRAPRAVKSGVEVPPGALPTIEDNIDRKIDLQERLAALRELSDEYLFDEERGYLDLTLSEGALKDKEVAVALSCAIGLDVSAGQIRYIRERVERKIKVYFALRRFFRGCISDRGPFLTEDEFRYVVNKRLRLKGKTHRDDPANLKVNTAIATMLLLGDGHIADEDCEIIKAWLFYQSSLDEVARSFDIPDCEAYCRKLGRKLHAKVLIENPDQMTSYTCEFLSLWIIEGNTIEQAESTMMQKVATHRARNAELKEQKPEEQREFATREFNLATALQQIKLDYRNLSSFVPPEFRELEFDYVTRRTSAGHRT